MNKKLLISLLSVLVLSAATVMADDTTTETTDARPQPPEINSMRKPDIKPDFNQNNGDFAKRRPPQMNGENKNGQFDGRRPKFKPDSQPGGKMAPKEWDSSANNGQPPKMKEGLKYGLKDGLKNGLKNGQINGEQKSE